MSKEWAKRMEDSHAKVDNVTVTVGVIVVVEDVPKGGDEREREESILDDDAVVEVVNGIKLCKRGQSRSSTSGEFTKGSVFCARLEALRDISVQTFPLMLEVQLIVDKAVTVQSMKKDSSGLRR